MGREHNLFIHVRDNMNGTYTAEELYPNSSSAYRSDSVAAALNGLLGIPSSCVEGVTPKPVELHIMNLKNLIKGLQVSSNTSYSSRELSLTITRLEEALSWLEKAPKTLHEVCESGEKN